ncbi:hypothetical protein PHJA_000792400 [Phtheirospermum japonicum]|uniref:BOD1/SHG1 domain-containing protein n=1 Tax=Phtheirospermum japonicum TaxID=374723 RepID=A0A830BHX2_9LAMI|nr:hypothetical protein PHJA_000792400 [Phtheirospermum japonicum]
MQNTGVNSGGGGGGRVRAEDVISKLKDDGDFDRLRLKIIRKLKENEELRSNIISLVKQSTALNRPGIENMKPRQLSDAIHHEIGDYVMNQISDGVWNVIRSHDGMKKEITETVQSVYDTLSNPRREQDNGESSSHKDVQLIRNERENNNCEATVAMETNGGTVSDEEPHVPPGFGSTNVKNKRDNLHLESLSEPDNMNCDAPPGFPAILNIKNSGDASDEDPDVPPGFG